MAVVENTPDLEFIQVPK